MSTEAVYLELIRKLNRGERLSADEHAFLIIAGLTVLAMGARTVARMIKPAVDALATLEFGERL